MQHFGDLQPLGQPDILTDHAPIGSYSARRSRWRFAVGSLEVGFDRATEEVRAERRSAAAPPPRLDFGARLMMLVGILGSVALIVAGAGWAWSSRASALASGESVSASIVEHESAFARGPATASSGAPTVIPTGRPPSRLSAVIAQRAPAPAVAATPRASLQIAEGETIAPRPASDDTRLAPTPDDAIVSSGNFLLIPSVASAVARAMADGEAQNWIAGRYHGVVVVGPGEVDGGKTCRQGTVLLRDGTTQGRTQRFDRCS